MTRISAACEALTNSKICKLKADLNVGKRLHRGAVDQSRLISPFANCANGFGYEERVTGQHGYIFNRAISANQRFHFNDTPDVRYFQPIGVSRLLNMKEFCSQRIAINWDTIIARYSRRGSKFALGGDRLALFRQSISQH